VKAERTNSWTQDARSLGRRAIEDSPE